MLTHSIRLQGCVDVSTSSSLGQLYSARLALSSRLYSAPGCTNRPQMTLGQFKYEVSGKVQGVFFRATTAEEGQKLGLAGWVMITPSGSVKGEAQGDVDKLATFKDFLQHKGSPGSRIDRCDISDEKEVDRLSYDKFEVRR